MNWKAIVFTAVFVGLAVPLGAAQGQGMGGGAGRQGNPARSNSQIMQRGQMGQMGQMGQQDRQRLRIHATQQQRMQYGACTQSMNQVRTRIRQMKKTFNGKSIDAQQARRLHQQLTNEIRSMTREQENFSAALDDQQRIAVQDQLRDMQQNRNQMDSLSEALGFALDQDTPDRDRLRDQIRDLDRVSDRLRDQQRTVASNLVID